LLKSVNDDINRSQPWKITMAEDHRVRHRFPSYDRSAEPSTLVANSSNAGRYRSSAWIGNLMWARPPA
jgi:hypothetical protein